MNTVQGLALFYAIPIALWLGLLAILFRVWWSHKLEDSLAYLVFLRERKVLFISLLAALTVLHVIVEFVNLVNGLGGLPDSFALGLGLVATIVGALIVFLFAWFLLRGAAGPHRSPVVLDLPEHLAYSLGVLDRAESESSPPKGAA